MKLGLFPFLQFAYKVNCEIRSSSPPTVSRDRFVFPCSSSKIRSPSIFFTILSAISFVSESHTPIKTMNPLPILPSTSPSTFTSLSVTRWITNLITYSPFLCSTSVPAAAPVWSPQTSARTRLILSQTAFLQERSSPPIPRSMTQDLRSKTQLPDAHSSALWSAVYTPPRRTARPHTEAASSLQASLQPSVSPTQTWRAGTRSRTRRTGYRTSSPRPP